jgi:hypothetical protein
MQKVLPLAVGLAALGLAAWTFGWFGSARTAASAPPEPAAPEPVVTLPDPLREDEVTAVFVDRELLDAHGVTPEDLKRAFEYYLATATGAAREAWEDLLQDIGHRAGGAGGAEKETVKPHADLSYRAFRAIYASARLEKWRRREDGGYEVLRVIKPGTPEESAP